MKKILTVLLVIMFLFLSLIGATAVADNFEVSPDDEASKEEKITYDYYEKIDVHQLIKSGTVSREAGVKHITKDAMNKIIGNGYLMETPVDELITETYDLDLVWDVEPAIVFYLGGGPLTGAGIGTRSLVNANEDYKIECIRPINDRHLMTINKVKDKDNNLYYCYTLYFSFEEWDRDYRDIPIVQLWMPVRQFLVSKPLQASDFDFVKEGTLIYDVLEKIPEQEITTIPAFTTHTKKDLLDFKDSETKVIYNLIKQPILSFKQVIMLTDGYFEITYATDDEYKDYRVESTRFFTDYEELITYRVGDPIYFYTLDELGLTRDDILFTK